MKPDDLGFKKIVSNLTKNLNFFYIVCDYHHHSSSKVKFFTANEDCTVFLLCVTQKIGRFGLFHEIYKKKILFPTTLLLFQLEILIVVQGVV